MVIMAFIGNTSQLKSFPVVILMACAMQMMMLQLSFRSPGNIKAKTKLAEDSISNSSSQERSNYMERIALRANSSCVVQQAGQLRMQAAILTFHKLDTKIESHLGAYSHVLEAGVVGGGQREECPAGECI